MRLRRGLAAPAAQRPGIGAPDPPGANTSTSSENVRWSPEWSAPTPTTCRASSSPFSFLTVTRTEYSHA